MAYKKTSSKLNSGIVKYGQAYTVVPSEGDCVNSTEFKQHLSKAQVEAQKLLQDSLLQVEQTISRAQTEASAILEQAQSEASKIQAQAQEAGQQMGYNAGYQAGYNQAVEEANNILTSAETIINGAYQAQKEIIMSTEKEMLGLVCAVARKVIQKELKMQPDIILRITETAIRELKDRDIVRIMVNPKAVNLMIKASEILKKRINSLKTIKIIEDKSVPEGGVIVESPSGKIDARIDTQLEEIYNKLVEEALTNPAKLQLPETTQLSVDQMKQYLDNEKAAQEEE